MNIIGIMTVDFTADQLYWTALECTGVPSMCIKEYRSNF